MRALAPLLVVGTAVVAGAVLAVMYGALLRPPLGAPLDTSGSPGASPRRSDPLPTAGPGKSAPIQTITPTGPYTVLVGAGDIATCDGFEDDATADALEGTPGIVFTLGDNAYPDGSRRAFAECYDPTWGRPSIKERTRPAVGDNEYGAANDAKPYFDYFGKAAGDPTTGYYAYKAGTWRVYVLNSNCRFVGGCEAGSRQERWLRQELVDHPSNCVVAMWHDPLFSSGPHGSNPVTTDLWQALQDADAELVLVGDDHIYERFAPQTAAGVEDNERGIVEIVVGTGGAQAHDFGSIVDNSMVRASPTFGVLRLELAANSYRFEFLSVGGNDFSDTGEGSCH
jgi:hypothetical protein